MKKLHRVIIVLWVAVSFVLGGTSASAAPGPARPALDRNPVGITWQ